MSWIFDTDPERYADRVLPLLHRNPASSTIALTVLDSLRSGHGFSGAGPLLGCYEQDGQVTGAVSMTPPYGLLLTALPPGSEQQLAHRLREDDVEVPDVNGTVADVERFIGCWSPAAAQAPALMRQRLYRLVELNPPEPLPAGSSRVAGAQDLDLVMTWLQEFVAEAEPRSILPARAMYERRIELGLIWFWLDDAGDPVSIAGRNVMIAAMSRVGPVYTPTEHRRHGYGAAATHACTADALAQGANTVVLFTDLDNPTSNAIYQRLGYRPLEDRVIQPLG